MANGRIWVNPLLPAKRVVPCKAKICEGLSVLRYYNPGAWSGIVERAYRRNSMNFKQHEFTIHLVTFVYLAMTATGAVIKRGGSTISETENSMPVDYNPHGTEKCRQIPEIILSAVLGPAFNARYMSIDDPRNINTETDSNTNVASSGVQKRKIGNRIPSFAVDEEYNSVFSNDPAWEVGFVNEHGEKGTNEDRRQETFVADDEDLHAGETRESRHVKNIPWQCDATVKWLDLGKDYFPRFLRTIECAKTNCWYGYYNCKARSFTVKLLRRRTGICVTSPSLDEILTTAKIGDAGLPYDLKELWIWEERAVNFCCECVYAATSANRS